MVSEEQYLEAIRRIDDIHIIDPSVEIIDGKEIKAELLYSNRMLTILEKVDPNSSFELKLAAKCQHMSRYGVFRVEPCQWIKRVITNGELR